MQIRDNVRERRRERIEQLIGLHEIERAKISDNSLKDSSKSNSAAEENVWADSASTIPTINASSNSTPSRSPAPHYDSNMQSATRYDLNTPLAPRSDSNMQSVPRSDSNTPSSSRSNLIAPPAPRSDSEIRPSLSSQSNMPPPPDAYPAITSTDITSNPNPDPEQWWKEREKQLKTGQAPGWQGLKGIPGIPPSSGSRVDNPPGGFNLKKLIRGFTLRLVVASLAFIGIWGWFKLEMPGSIEGRNWMVSSVTQDMNFQAVEAWYSENFGGVPSFLSFSNNEPDTKEVSALLNPSETAIPIKGKLVQTFAQNGTGVKIAASGGSQVYAIYTGRVQQVTQDPDGGVTIILQHENQIQTIYGSLDIAKVKANDWVQTGQQLGQVSNSGDGNSQGVLYFAVQQNGEMLNPAEVITLD
ncbi:peptidoglycan DD-metalloendopeptidase family protein [Cohnella sp. WQ 127256]|uniref:peptidoglycan DD-metalloendopeptidase family protein n=1 Tax=Cohnella sp. WQ 127256 TaxID=2938790 RepID=UPI002117FBFC|nr:peptidoglycan DD-metalloendopeptidase family protein [Cohnella sp. WQ 127256]